MSRRIHLMPTKRRQKAAPVESLRPNPLAWKEALRLAKGDAKRLVVRDVDEVVVLNSPR